MPNVSSTRCANVHGLSAERPDAGVLVLDELAASDGKTLFEICSLLTIRHGLGLTRQAISQHLGVLESAGLVVTERRGRSKLHFFNPAPLSEITRRWPITERTDS